MDQIIVNLDERILSLILAIAMLAAGAMGRWMERRLVKNGNLKPSKFDDAAVAVMGLLLAFAFGSSISRYDQRRMAVVEDSNAIGDFYTCAGLLNEPTRTELQSVIQQYAKLRLDLTRAPINEAILESALTKFDHMQSQMSELVGQALTRGTPIAGSLTNTLSAVSSRQASRLATIRDSLPNQYSNPTVCQCYYRCVTHWPRTGEYRELRTCGSGVLHPPREYSILCYP